MLHTYGQDPVPTLQQTVTFNPVPSLPLVTIYSSLWIPGSQGSQASRVPLPRGIVKGSASVLPSLEVTGEVGTFLFFNLKGSPESSNPLFLVTKEKQEAGSIATKLEARSWSRQKI